MKLFPVLSALLLFGWTTQPALAQVSVQGEFVTSVPQRPTVLTAQPDDASRIYATNKLGRIYLIEDGTLNFSPFMDITRWRKTGARTGSWGWLSIRTLRTTDFSTCPTRPARAPVIR